MRVRVGSMGVRVRREGEGGSMGVRVGAWGCGWEHGG